MPIFDQGYQHWSGEVSGHMWRWLAITRRGVRTALKTRVVRLSLFVFWLPPLVLAFVLCMWGLVERQSDMIELVKPLISGWLGTPILNGPRDYRVQIWTVCFHFFLWWELWVAMGIVLLVGPNLISQDLRYNALPLYLSRPLRRIDYFAGKLGVVVWMICIAIIVPTIFAYLLGLAFSLDITIIRDTYRILLGSVAYGLIIAVSAGLLMLALSSLSRNSRYVALMWIGVWIVTSVVSAALVGIERERRINEMDWRPKMRQSDDFIQGEIAAGAADWRPLISYTGNLQRLEEHLIGTNAAWERLGKLAPAKPRAAMLQKLLGTQHPWYWSATILMVIAACSMLVLSFSVKSLDKLK